ncbi:hypothetical protein ABIB35_003320 [Arthrobacter sp. UYP6]|uniref:DUF6308 family protein n=1 Tax=Arthrobacter sp. UYP6 TaxID=1756378 RepID=UPI0033932700
MQIPKVLLTDQTDNAVLLLSNYYTKPQQGKSQLRSGARFDNWAGGGDAPGMVNTLTADDFLAASFLSVRFSPKAVIGILEQRRGEVTALLAQIPADLDLASVTHENFKSVLGEESPAWQLRDLLRGKDLPDNQSWGIGPTKASKLMARKRPRLVPIWDSVVRSETELKDSGTQWSDWHEVLTQNDCALSLHLDDIQRKAELPHPISPLRAMDVILWMRGTGGVQQSPTSEDETA